eukprot:2898399-Alexandrium_andersonii.AAC.1
MIRRDLWGSASTREDTGARGIRHAPAHTAGTPRAETANACTHATAALRPRAALGPGPPEAPDPLQRPWGPGWHPQTQTRPA